MRWTCLRFGGRFAGKERLDLTFAEAALAADEQSAVIVGACSQIGGQKRDEAVEEGRGFENQGGSRVATASKQPRPAARSTATDEKPELSSNAVTSPGS